MCISRPESRAQGSFVGIGGARHARVVAPEAPRARWGNVASSVPGVHRRTLRGAAGREPVHWSSSGGRSPEAPPLRSARFPELGLQAGCSPTLPLEFFMGGLLGSLAAA